jgi:hypothetical protein
MAAPGDGGRWTCPPLYETAVLAAAAAALDLPARADEWLANKAAPWNQRELSTI